ncbi:SAV_915 family protein [Streptosporangium roseum]|uniref:SAV_915 family protein n=1 Tax=Streptosporangium roseum TaxID=2001 RepID=UPI0009DE3018|nr:SAV_915 family protein [Streptosporangium roseum]
MSEAPLYVPVREGAFISLRLFKTASGKSAAAAFSSPARLARVLGADQRWIRLSEPALRSMIGDLAGVGIVIDPAGTMTRLSSQVA